MTETQGGIGAVGCRPKVALIVIAVLIASAGIVWILSLPPSDLERHESRLAMERADALQPWNIALGIAWRVVAIGAGLVFLIGLAGATRAVVGLLGDRRRTIEAKDGIFPARVLRPGESLADLNRAPDGKIQAAPVGWLGTLVVRLVLGARTAAQLSRPAVTILPHDTSPAQLRITSQAQVVQALAATQGSTSSPMAPGAPWLLPMMRPTQQLPPLVTLDQAPDEIRLLVEAGQGNWDQREDNDAPLLLVDQLE